MRARMIATVVAVYGTWLVAPMQPVRADEVAELKEQIRLMEERHQQTEAQHRKDMEALQARLQAVEARQLARQAPSAPGPAGAAAPEVAELQEEVAGLQEQQDTLLKRLEKQIDWHMYAVLEAENFQTTDASFDAREVEFIARGKLTDRLSALADFELERTATTEAGPRQGSVETVQGWMQYDINRYLKPRFGVVTVPFGRFNWEHFSPIQYLTDRPVSMRRVVPVTWSEAGAGVVGDAAPGEALGGWFKDLSLRYETYFVNGLTAEVSDQGLRDARGAFGQDNNNNKGLVGRLGISPLPKQELGLSSYVGAYDKDGHSINGFDVDWHTEYGPFQLLGEWASWHLQPGFETASGTQTTTVVPRRLSGGYIEARYHFWFDALNHTFLGRGFKKPTFALIGMYDRASIADDGDAGTGPNIEERWVLGFNYRPVESWVFKLEYQNNRKKTETLERGDADGFIASVTAVF